MLLESDTTDTQMVIKNGSDTTGTASLFSKTANRNDAKLTIDDEFHDPVILDRLRGTIKLKLQGSISLAMKELLSTLSLSIEEVDCIKKVTLELQKRIQKIETVSRKVGALIVESMPPASKSTVAMQDHPIDVITDALLSPLLQLAEEAPPSSDIVIESLPVVSTAPSASLHSSSYSQAQVSSTPPQISSSAPIPPVTTALTCTTDPLTVEVSPTITSVAPLPSCTQLPPSVRVQPPLILSISVNPEGVCLQWDLDPVEFSFQPATLYELYSYASSDVDHRFPLSSDVWQKVGTIEALPLPMICTLTSVQPENVYYFAVRSIDQFQCISDWSNIVDVHVT